MLAQKLIGATATGGIDVQYLATYTGNTSSSQSITGVSFGEVDTTRRIYVMIGFIRPATSGTTSVTSVTIGGVSASLIRMVSSTRPVFSAVSGFGLFAADVPTGTSGTVSVVFSGDLATPTPSFFVYRVVGQEEPLETALVDYVSSLSTGTTSRSVTVDSDIGGFALGLIQLTAARVVSFNVPQSTTTSSNRVAGLLVPTTEISSTITVSWSSTTGALLSVISIRK